MSTTPRPIIGAETVPQQEPTSTPPAKPQIAQDLPLARGLASWDLVPSDLILVRRRPVKK